MVALVASTMESVEAIIQAVQKGDHSKLQESVHLEVELFGHIVPCSTGHRSPFFFRRMIELKPPILTNSCSH